MKKIKWWGIYPSGSEKRKVKRVIKSGFWNEGKITTELEKCLGSFLQVKYSHLTTSGTSALFLALKAVGVQYGDKVLVPNLTFIASANSVVQAGGNPVLVDISMDTLSFNRGHLEKLLTENPDIKFAILVHISGKSSLNPEIMLILESRKIKIIEDAAEAFGSNCPFYEKKLGSIGLAGAYSFSPNKIITSGQGGLVVTSDNEISKKIILLKDQGRPVKGSGGDDLHPSIGFNFKFNDIQAALLTSQFESIIKRIEHLKFVYNYYSNNLHKDHLNDLVTFDISAGEFPLWPMLFTHKKSQMILKLDALNIEYRSFWFPISTQLPYAEQDSEYLSGSKILSLKGIWLPSFFRLKKRDLKRITNGINSLSI
jgi:perosamine synthetase